MLKQASSRNNRSKGFKVKHALQICLLIAICIWLLYQVKHSHEKKRAFEERNSKISKKVTENEADLFKFGRKDLPRTEDKGSANESHSQEDENEETQDEEELVDIKQEEIEDEEGIGAGDDDIDEQDQDDGDEEAELGEEESTEEEDKDSHNEVDMVDDRQHEGGTQEAREENYKRDDASSAVAHATQETESKAADEEQVINKVDESGVNGSKRDGYSSVNGDGGDADGSKGEGVAENVEKKVVLKGSDDGSRGDNDSSAGSRGASVSNVSDTVVSGTGNLSSGVVTAADNKDLEVEFSKPDNGTVTNSAAAGANSLMEQQTNLTMAAESHTQAELQANATSALDHQIEMQKNSTVFDSDGISTLNDTSIVVTTGNATPAEEDVRSSQNAEGQGENGDVARGGSDSSERATITEEEEKRGRTDLSTLPNIQSEAKSTDDEAAAE